MSVLIICVTEQGRHKRRQTQEEIDKRKQVTHRTHLRILSRQLSSPTRVDEEGVIYIYIS